MNIFKAEEKLEICKELGLKNATQYFSRVLKELNINFRKTSEKEIEMKLKNLARKSLSYKLQFGKFIKSFWILFSISSLLIFSANFALNGISKESILVSIFFSFLSSLISLSLAYDFSDIGLTIRTESLEDWQEDLPYGALLASKEAIEKGLTDFTIHYPKFGKSDPILTAEDANGELYEIFFWDDEKIRNT